MSNSTTHLDTISSSQAQKEVTANALLDAASPAMLYGRRASTSAALTWGFYGGVAAIGGTPTAIANGTVALTASATNYIEADPIDGSVSANTVGFTGGSLPLYEVVAGASTVTSYTDWRVFGSGSSGAVSSVNTQTGEVVLDAGDVGADAAGTALDVMVDHLADANPHPEYLTQAEADALYAPVAGTNPFDVHAFYPGVPGASAKITRVPFARAVTFPANFAGSYFTASVNATSTTVFDVQKNGSTIGSISIAAGGTVATFTTTGGTSKSFAAGDVMQILAPASPDATLADAGFALAGTR